MKVERGGGRSAASAGGAGGQRQPSAVSGVSFADSIRSATESAEKASIDALIASIEEQGRELVQRPTPGNLDHYRSLVLDFMKRVVGEGFSTESIPSARYLENNKVFVVARRIEERLHELADKIASGQTDAMAIMAATSEIRGLLMDLLG